MLFDVCISKFKSSLRKNKEYFTFIQFSPIEASEMEAKSILLIKNSQDCLIPGFVSFKVGCHVRFMHAFTAMTELLNVIPLGPDIFDHINRMTTISDIQKS